MYITLQYKGLFFKKASHWKTACKMYPTKSFYQNIIELQQVNKKKMNISVEKCAK